MPLRERPPIVLVNREGQIAISHAGAFDPLVFETDIKALLAEYVCVQLIIPHRCEFVPISRRVLRSPLGWPIALSRSNL